MQRLKRYGSWFRWEQGLRSGLSFPPAASKIFFFVKNFCEQGSVVDAVQKGSANFFRLTFSLFEKIFLTARLIFSNGVLQSPTKINASKSLIHAGFSVCAIRGLILRHAFICSSEICNFHG